VNRADVCLILEGAYPYVSGGVSGWTQALIQAAPHLRFHLVSIMADNQPREVRYALPSNVVGWTDLALDSGFPGRGAKRSDAADIAELGRQFERLIVNPDAVDLGSLAAQLRESGLGQSALLNSRAGWRAMEAANQRLLPNSPILDFFWTWRVMLRSLITVLGAPAPDAKIYHAISTGYAGLFGARMQHETGRPLLLTEHGVYTNERRIELSLADWIFDSGDRGYSIAESKSALRDLWSALFASLAKLTYQSSAQIITLYRGNQTLQAADGAVAAKCRIIPNGVDFEKFSAIKPIARIRRRPTVALIGRVVPIKDVRMFILACAALRRRIPDVEAMIIGPDDEDASYADDCRDLVRQEDLTDCVRFTGRTDVAALLQQIDVCVLTSVSEAQPLVLLEAGAAGIPSVATDVGACRELIEGAEGDAVVGHGGIVVAVGDSSATADAMAILLTDEPMRRRMGDIMRRRVAESYNKRQIDRIYTALYESHLQARLVEVA
jgi:glycosyltransferase involved in cell wall biosynthesis